MKAVLVTGCSTGIGRAVVIKLADTGFLVYAGVRKAEDIVELSQLGIDNLVPINLDVCDDDSINHLCERLQQDLGGQGLYGLINNAGVAQVSPLEFIGRQQLEVQMETNLCAPVLLTARLLPLLRQAKGRVINISSGAAIFAAPFLGVYSATKSALESISEALRVELRNSGVQVVIVQPGFVRSDIHHKNDRAFDQLQTNLPAKGLSYYGTAIEKLRSSNKKMAASATSAEACASIVNLALSVDSPRRRYRIGTDAKLAALLLPLMPGRLKDALFGKISGL